MREIKFKAWSSFWKRMYIVESINFETKFVTGYDINRPDDSYYNLGENFNEDVELLEFTGLKDKNGKEIYEGHIVWCKLNRGHKGGNFAVTWSDICAHWTVYATELYRAKEIKIIGNTYENKDLLQNNDTHTAP